MMNKIIKKGMTIICSLLIASALSGCFNNNDFLDNVKNQNSIFQNTPEAPSVSQLPQTEYSEFCYIRNNGNLNSQQKIMYDLIYNGILNFETKIDVSSSNMTFSGEEELTEAIDDIMHAVFSDHPEIFWYANNFMYTYDIAKFSPTKIELTLLYDRAERDKMQAEIDAVTTDLLKEAEGLGEYERSEYFYTKIIEKTSYIETDNAHNIYGALVSGKAVCEGYAKAYQYLMTKSGIMALYVYGSATGDPMEPLEAHGWNLVKINGNWYQTDCTWGDPVLKEGSESSRTVNYSYLNVTEGDLMGTHIMDKQLFDVPDCNSVEDNFFVKEGLYFEEFDSQQVSSEIEKRLSVMNKEKETELHIKFKKDTDAQKAYAYLTESIDGNAYFFSLAEGLTNRVSSYVVTSVNVGSFTFFISY